MHDPIPRAERIERRIAERRVELMLRYLKRLPALFVGYVILAVVAMRQGLVVWPWVWLALTGVMMYYRWTLARRVEKQSAVEKAAALPRLNRGFALSGLVTAPIVLLAYSAPNDEAPLLMGIMLVTGCTVAAASMAGSVPAFLGLCTPTFGLIAGGWFLRGGTLGISFGIGVLIMYVVLLASVRDHDRNLKELMALVEDNAKLSESVELERDRAEAASAAKTRFFAAASHDLRQPLHALSINATTLEILAQRGNDVLLKEISRGIGSALRQSSGLLDTLLDISRLEAHSIEPRLAAHDIGTLLRAVHDEYAALAAQQSLQLQVDLPAETLWCLTDSDQLLRILGNLVNNAIKFTERGGVTLSARRGPRGHVLVQVADTGSGIPLDQRERVFEEFYQLDNTPHDRAQGLGLGLAIVRRTAALLKHKLRLDSIPGRGTTFELRIASAMPPSQPPARAAARARPAESLPLTVLLIDGESEGLAALCTYLTQLGWTVEGVESGDQAELALANGYVPDVLVIDYRLRGETDLDVIERVRQRLPGVPAVIVTGETAPERFADLSRAAERVLHKPLSGDVLARTLQEVVARAGALVTESGSARY
ncbi:MULTISPECIES: hybrid sensor histidine kinase/response regulator [unclassified Variovorax]|uniref:ATP-binding response regulator n=1 Tax=unclassified Variovorax TaxID=663243 RepID=UPI001BD5AC56|nr:MULTISPECIES: hybrid sensor histidine kinase/response regulator [unclassified Variovorax]